MLSARAELPHQLAVERVDHCYGIHWSVDVRDIADNLEAMGTLELSAAPGVQEVAVGSNTQHRGILALEDLQTVAGIRRDAANEAEGLAGRQFCEILDES